MDDEITVRDVRNALRDKEYRHANETELERGIDEVLTKMGLTVRRQVRLSERDRIDLATELPRTDGPAIRVGIEIKVQGPAHTVRRQLTRYTEHDEIDALLLVTTMYKHMFEISPHTEDCPPGHRAGARRMLAGKPFELVLLRRGSF